MRLSSAAPKAINIRIRAERRAGQIEKTREKTKRSGANQDQDRSRGETDPQTLADLGVSKSQSSRWQKLAPLGSASGSRRASRSCSQKHR
jgi:hypothetical protein